MAATPSKKILILANILTLSRMLIVPLIVALLIWPCRGACIAAVLLFMLASATDWLDGYVARRDNVVTSFGKFLDPLADKVLICCMLVMLAQQRWVPGWIAAVIIARELIVTGLRTLAFEQGIVLGADRWGKAKTLTQILALIPLTLHYPLFGWNPVPAGTALLYLALALTVLSGANYLYSFRKVLAGGSREETR